MPDQEHAHAWAKAVAWMNCYYFSSFDDQRPLLLTPPVDDCWDLAWFCSPSVAALGLANPTMPKKNNS